MNLRHVAEGWTKSLGLMDVSAEEKLESERRILICSTCPMAEESKTLKLLRGKAEHMKVIKCGDCGCPVNEKSIVMDERCDLGKWDK